MNAPITTTRGFVMRHDIRNNTRVMFDDRALAADLHARLTGRCPRGWRARAWSAVNERFRCYRHERGQRFATRCDPTSCTPTDRRGTARRLAIRPETAGGGRASEAS
jgi:prolyl 4-hydroxylase